MRVALINTMTTNVWRELFSKISHNVEVMTLDDNDDIVNSVLDADILVFAGGADIKPSLYHEAPHKLTHAIEHKRDMHELALAEMAIKFSIPMIGICRGAQLLCVANGGKLVQDVANHRTRHLMHTISDHSFQVTSTHHQMMAPEGVYSVLGWSDVCNSWAGMPAGYPTNPKRTEEKDVEVVWWRDTNSLAFQYHPEQMDGQSDGQKYFINTVKTFLSESRA